MTFWTFKFSGLIGPDHPDFGSVNHKVLCTALIAEEEESEARRVLDSILKRKLITILEEEKCAHLGIPEGPTRSPAVDAQMENLRQFGFHFEWHQVALKEGMN